MIFLTFDKMYMMNGTIFIKKKLVCNRGLKKIKYVYIYKVEMDVV